MMQEDLRDTPKCARLPFVAQGEKAAAAKAKTAGLPGTEHRDANCAKEPGATFESLGEPLGATKATADPSD